MNWTDIPWSAIAAVLASFVAFIVWLIRLEARAGSNKREIEIVNEKVPLVNTRVGANETLLAEVRTTAVTKTDLRDHEERVTRSVDNGGRQVTGEIDRLVRVMDSPPKTGTRN